MFPRGPRFDPPKASDVPGPNAYNPQDSPQDIYKRGAFIEKTERFAMATNASKPSHQAQHTTDRYTVLQRKVEDLERLHNDGKKAHQSEVDRLKLELTRLHKSSAEMANRTDKLKKHNETLDVRIQDLKKASSSDQAELRDLRAKLRLSEHERTQMVTKQIEAGELKKSESKLRAEIREKDLRIMELEKAAASEKKRREAAEINHLDLNAKADEELLSSRVAAKKLEALVDSAQAETRDAQTVLTAFKAECQCKEERLLAQLEQHQHLLRRVAEEYGSLVSRTVSTFDHTRLKKEHTTLLIHAERLERKLAGSRVQVVELTSMIRDAKEQIQFLKEELYQAEAYMPSDHHALVGTPSTSAPQSDSSLESIYYAIHQEFAGWRSEMQTVNIQSLELASDFYHLACEELLLAYSATDKQLQDEQLASQQHVANLSSALASHEAIAACLDTAQKERHAAEERLKIAEDLTDELRISSNSITNQLKETEEKMCLAAVANDVALKKEKNTVQALTSTVQKCRMAEDALRSEIELLTTELTDAERYQEAYYSLSDEVGSLVARNQLAEEEAQRLSKFNAEILSHNNPAQRIMYVDRIRRELAETKHKLVMLAHEKENVVAENGDLQHELSMYKSVVVPAEQRPRTNITRVARLPLVNLTQSLNVGGVQLQKSHAGAENVP